MISFVVWGHVPAKANNYRIVCRSGRPRIIRTPEVIAYQQQVADGAALWVRQHGGCLFPQEKLEVWLFWHRLTHDGKRRDVDNIAKVTKDGITQGGLWTDDSQVTLLHIEALYDAQEDEWLDIVIRPDPLQPTHRKRR